LRIDLWGPLNKYDYDVSSCGISAWNIAVVPGYSHWIAVSSIGCSNPLPIAIFDDGVMRPKVGPLSPFTGGDSLSFQDSTTLWTSRDKLTLNSSGAVAQESFTNFVDINLSRTTVSGKKVFVSGGNVLSADPIGLESTMYFGFVGGDFTYNPQNNRVYFSGATTGYVNLGIQEFNPDTSQLTGQWWITQPTASFAACPAESSQLVTTGNIGFAMFTGDLAVSKYSDGGPVCIIPQSLIQPTSYSLPSVQPKGGTVRRFDLPITSAVASADGQVFYVATSAAAANLGGQILTFDPNGGSFRSPAYVGSNPGLLTLSASGQSLFAQLYGAEAMVKLSLPSLTAQYRFPIVNKMGRLTTALEVEPLGALDDSLVISQYNDGSPWELIAVYDRGVKRQNTTKDWIYNPSDPSCLADSFQLSTDGSTMWAMDTYTTPSCFSKWQISATGLSQTAAVTPRAGFQGMIACQSGFCFTEGGTIINENSLAVVGAFGTFGAGIVPGTNWVLTDLASKRVFYVDSFGAIQVFGFDPANPALTTTPLATYHIANYSSSLNGAFRWKDELVVCADAGIVMVPLSVMGLTP